MIACSGSLALSITPRRTPKTFTPGSKYIEFNMRTSGTLTAGLVASLGLLGGASAAVVDARQSCPAIHVFGARETTVSPGYGSAAGLVNAIRSAFPGATSEAINYPACGGQASCGNIAYGDSVRAGTQAVATAVNSFNQRCPDTKIVVVGYSQVSSLCNTTRRWLTFAIIGRPDLRQRVLRRHRSRRGHLDHRVPPDRQRPRRHQGRHPLRQPALQGGSPLQRRHLHGTRRESAPKQSL